MAVIDGVTSRRRETVADLDEIVGSVDDARELDSVGVKQAWQYAAVGAPAAELRHRGRDERCRVRLCECRGPPRACSRRSAARRRPAARLALAPSGDSYGLFVEDRVRFTDRLIADLGLRWDRQNYLPPGVDSQFSPRASLLYRIGSKTDLRLSHGRFFQPEGLLELQVEDGVTAFARAQSAAHSIVSIERRFAGTLALRAELYRKTTQHVRPRYENLFDPLVLLPELRASRALVEPERS